MTSVPHGRTSEAEGIHPGVAALAAELAARRRPPWASPFHWWGPAWARPEPQGLDELVAQGVLSAGLADRLRETVTAGGSVVVAAGPSRVGKSTLAAALAEWIPVERQRVYPRGCYETFDFIAETTAGERTLLVNEIGPHLPIYLWGDAARRVLALARDGAQLIATIHADSPEEVVYQLSRPPVAATPDEIAALGTVVFLGPPEGGGDRWRVRRVARFHATGQGVMVEEGGV